MERGRERGWGGKREREEEREKGKSEREREGDGNNQSRDWKDLAEQVQLEGECFDKEDDQPKNILA